MEKAMHGAHGVGYETYKRQHKVRMQVEREERMNIPKQKNDC